MDDHGQGIETLAIDHHVQLDQVGRLVAFFGIVEGGIAMAQRFQAIKEIQHNLRPRQFIAQCHLTTNKAHAQLTSTP